METTGTTVRPVKGKYPTVLNVALNFGVLTGTRRHNALIKFKLRIKIVP